MTRVLDAAEARRFYDRFGRRQDQQAFYEDAAIELLLVQGRWERSSRVVELGCGTGRVAQRLLEERLGSAAEYRGFDLSSTMVDLARQRLAAFGPRVQVERTEGQMELPLESASQDRFLSTYVLDLLSEADIAAALSEAHRVLRPEGRLCLASLAEGVTGLSRVVSSLFRQVHRLRPSLVGGCRPLSLVAPVRESGFTVEFERVVVAWGVPSEVIVARR